MLKLNGMDEERKLKVVETLRPDMIGNKFALGNTGGRPPKFATTQELQRKCEDYFTTAMGTGEKICITGLCLFLGFSSRSSLVDYCKRGDEFSHIIKRAKLAVEYFYEQSGQVFDMFALKNMGWSDRVDTNITSNGDSINIPPSKWIEPD